MGVVPIVKAPASRAQERPLDIPAPEEEAVGDEGANLLRSIDISFYREQKGTEREEGRREKAQVGTYGSVCHKHRVCKCSGQLRGAILGEGGTVKQAA